MIPVRIDNLFKLALDVRGQAGQYGGSRSLPSANGSPLNRAAVCTGREEKPAAISCCPSATMWSAAIAFRQAFEHIAFPAYRRHDQGRLEGYLRDPGHRSRAVPIFAPRVSTYTPFESMRSVFCLTFASTALPRLSLTLLSIRFPVDPSVNAAGRPQALCSLPAIEHQAIARPAVDVMTLPLPANEAEAEAFYESVATGYGHRAQVLIA